MVRTQIQEHVSQALQKRHGFTKPQAEYVVDDAQTSQLIAMFGPSRPASKTAAAIVDAIAISAITQRMTHNA